MRFSIEFQRDKSNLKKPVNRNRHDAFEWTFAYDMSLKFQQMHGALEADWNSQKTLHDLYEIYNAPHVSADERTTKAAQYLAEKVHQLVHENKIKDIRQSVSRLNRSETVSWGEVVA